MSPNYKKAFTIGICIIAICCLISFLLPPKEAIPAVSPIAGDSLIYYHSIEEMQEWSGAEVDGIWGPETDSLYRAKWAEQYNNMCAKETWNGN